MTPEVLGLTVALGALGAVLRWLVIGLLPKSPWWSVGIVNVVGSAAVGVLAALPENDWTYPLIAGLAGGLTTFSTLAVLMIPRNTDKFATRVVTPLSLHLIAGVAACALGFIATQGLL